MGNSCKKHVALSGFHLHVCVCGGGGGGGAQGKLLLLTPASTSPKTELPSLKHFDKEN